MQSINDFLSLLLINQKIEILELALKLRIFEKIEKGINTKLNLASKLKVKTNKLEVLLEALIFMDLIKKNKNIYSNNSFSKKYLVFSNSSYCGDIFIHRKKMLNNANKLKNLLFGRSNIKEEKNLWAKASKKSLKQEQKQFMAPLALEIIKNLKDFSKINKVLDLACSSGIVGLELAKKYPHLELTFFDYEEVTRVVKEHIKEYKLKNKVKILSGDVQKDEIGEAYDLIWCSNLFYFLENKEEVIKKIYKSLNQNGIFISCHVEIDSNNSLDENSFFYFLSLNMQGKNILKPMELSNIFEKFSFKSVSSYTSNKTLMSKSQIHICRK